MKRPARKAKGAHRASKRVRSGARRSRSSASKSAKSAASTKTSRATSRKPSRKHRAGKPRPKSSTGRGFAADAGRSDNALLGHADAKRKLRADAVRSDDAPVGHADAKRKVRSDAVRSNDAGAPRKLRADAVRSNDAVLDAAKAVFESAGVDARVRDIAKRAGVGIGTVYRRFPHRADLLAAVFRREVDACEATAALLARTHEPGDAVVRWLRYYADLIATKRGLATALHSGDPMYGALADYFVDKLEPALASLLAPAMRAREIRRDVRAYDVMRAVGKLAIPETTHGHRKERDMLDVFVDGLRIERDTRTRKRR
ncbi:MAG: helix-turn-helix domain-containing protein [Kofleriaceae bacterium]